MSNSGIESELDDSLKGDLATQGQHQWDRVNPKATESPFFSLESTVSTIADSRRCHD